MQKMLRQLILLLLLRTTPAAEPCLDVAFEINDLSFDGDEFVVALSLARARQADHSYAPPRSSGGDKSGESSRSAAPLAPPRPAVADLRPRPAQDRHSRRRARGEGPAEDAVAYVRAPQDALAPTAHADAPDG